MILSVAIAPFLGVCFWALFAYIWVEITRDLWHYMGHRAAFLWKNFHGLHHAAYMKGFVVRSYRIFRKSLLRNDLLESVVMLISSIALVGVTHFLSTEMEQLSWSWLGSCYGVFISLEGLVLGTLRYCQVPWAQKLDKNHLGEEFQDPPSIWKVNEAYHYNHHYHSSQIAYSGNFALFDKVAGTVRTYKNSKVGVFGDSGALGEALCETLIEEGANVTAFCLSQESLTLKSGEIVPTVHWRVGEEDSIANHVAEVDVLILLHGVHDHENTAKALEKTFQINCFSCARLTEIFFASIKQAKSLTEKNKKMATKEVIICTSEAEAMPVGSLNYHLSKMSLGYLVSYWQETAPCIVRRLVLLPFESGMTQGKTLVSASKLTRFIIRLAESDIRNIVISLKPLVYLNIWLKEIVHRSHLRK